MSTTDQPVPSILEVLVGNKPRVPYVLNDIPMTPEAQVAKVGIAAGPGRGWKVLVNGKEIEQISRVELKNETMGRGVIYAWRPEGFDGVSLYEPAGGGAVTIPWVVMPDEANRLQIYAAVALEYRGPAGGIVANVPRGFLDPGTTHEDTVGQELHGETGLVVTQDRLTQLGVPFNANSDAYNTSGQADDGQPQGIRVYAIAVGESDVEPARLDDGRRYYRFKPEISAQAGDNKTAERILGTVFVPLQDLTRTPDAFSRVAAGDLLIHLLQRGVLKTV